MIARARGQQKRLRPSEAARVERRAKNRVDHALQLARVKLARPEDPTDDRGWYEAARAALADAAEFTDDERVRVQALKAIQDCASGLDMFKQRMASGVPETVVNVHVGPDLSRLDPAKLVQVQQAIAILEEANAVPGPTPPEGCPGCKMGHLTMLGGRACDRCGYVAKPPPEEPKDPPA